VNPFASELGFVVLRAISFCGLGECFTHEAVHSQNGAFYPFGREFDVGQSGDRSRAHTAAIVQPENATTSPQLRGRYAIDEAAVDLIEKDGLFDRRGGRSRGSIRDRGFIALRILKSGEEASGASFCRSGGLEVIVNNVRGDDFQETEDSVGIVGAEVLEQAAIVCTEFQVGFLNQIISQARYRFTPLSCRSEHHGRDQGMKAPDKFGPHELVPSRDTCRDQLVRG
jgi:hypothetical protein